MKTSLKNYTFRYLTISLLAVLTIWALLFHSMILDEVYDNVDDGLKNQKIEIIRESYVNPEIVKTNEFGLAQYRILPVSHLEYNEANRLTNEMVFMPYDGEEEPYRVLRTGFYGQDGKEYSLEIRTSTVEEDDLIYDLTIALIFLYIIILVSILLINHFGLDKAFRPFDKIMTQLQNYRFGQSKKIEQIETNVTEFYVLQNEISSMIDRNEKVFTDQRLFIENASHELQTPLAIAINKIDLMLDQSELNEKDYVQLAETKNSLWRMVNLNKSLLMLSRIENQHYANQSPINFKSLIQEIVEDYEPFFEDAEINVETNINQDFIINYNSDLARILISNLIRNAVKHNNEQKSIQVKIEADHIIIANTSNHGELNENVIFNRFYKQGNSDGSTGLGLSIVDTILKNQMNLKLDYRYQAPYHQFILIK
ncbi:sensor histidine kinase [Faecalibacter rhinopitheci]|uniref:histidine kinase n=1 Tax=Faecalibacter rhinopitheci TaxID=2779678 RepID=A0A8J7KD00_9FLAO|nr:HAMP domain-containing sensor histidine kinase [Faecalibacter rhinopitheci]MBF0596791.1 HAMP domain-containing histidine kinase [Faecalibacter rhinopitheci]